MKTPVLSYSPVLRDHCRALYLDGQPLAAIAKATRIPVKTLEEWEGTHDWVTQLRDRTVADIHERGEVIVHQEKPQVIERHIRIAAKLDSHIEKALDKKSVKSRDLVNLSKAAVGASNVADAALGLKKAASLQVFVQFNLAPIPVQDALRTGALTVEDLSPSSVRDNLALANPGDSGAQRS